MSASPMRSIIRILAESSLVERISLDHDNNNVKIHYRSETRNSDSVREMVDVVNYYFEKEFKTPNALILIDKDEKSSLPSSNNCHLSIYTAPLFDVYRIDLHDKFATNENYYSPDSDIIELEMIAVEHAKEFIFGELRKKGSIRRCVVEFNYMNLGDPENQNLYLSPLKRLPKTISRNIDISLVRVHPDADVEAMNKALDLIKGVAGDCSLSVYFDYNLPLIERMLNTKAEKIYLTIDIKRIKDESKIEQLHSLIKEHPKSKNVYVIQNNIDREHVKMIGETANTLNYAGRQVIRRENH